MFSPFDLWAHGQCDAAAEARVGASRRDVAGRQSGEASVLRGEPLALLDYADAGNDPDVDTSVELARQLVPALDTVFGESHRWSRVTVGGWRNSTGIHNKEARASLLGL